MLQPPHLLEDQEEGPAGAGGGLQPHRLRAAGQAGGHLCGGGRQEVESGRWEMGVI